MLPVKTKKRRINKFLFISLNVEEVSICFKQKKPAIDNCYRLFLFLKTNEIHIRTFSSEFLTFRGRF